MADEKKNTVVKPPRSNWSLLASGNRGKGMYSLVVIRIAQNGQGSGVQISDAFNNGTIQPPLSNTSPWAEFMFSMNPKSMSLEEPAAVTIVPTQDGGQFIEHQGQIYKNITITGTTGLRPNKTALSGLIGAVPFLGDVLGSETGLPDPGERTGFDDLVKLRNTFRRYWDLKVDPDAAAHTVMVWLNIKESEYYVVEPMSFRTNRDASSPLTFSYDIQFRTIEKFNIAKLIRQADSYSEINSPQSFFSRLSDIRRQLSAAFNTAQRLISVTAQIGQATINSVLNPVNDVLDALAGVVTSGSRFLQIPRNALSTVATSSTNLANAIDALPNNTYLVSGVAGQLATISNAFRRIARQLHALQVEDRLFATPLPSTINRKRQAYLNPITGQPRSGGSPTDLSNVNVANSAASKAVNGNEDIRGVARRLLGDESYWKVLVLLNGLKPPYISPAGDGVTVLRPGDAILVPQATGTAQAPIAPVSTKYNNIIDLTERLGRDFKLVTTTSAGGIVLYDFAKSSTGDLASQEGMDNMSQAIVIKFATEQGELATHPFFGIMFPIGSKARPQTLGIFMLNAESTLVSDRRIDTVAALDAFVEGNVLRMTGQVNLKGADQTLAVNMSIRS